jgi:extracellular elastinolytic metalloproteinase
VSRELDRRDFRESKLTETRKQHLHSLASSISEDLPGDQDLRIEAFDPTTANPAVVTVESSPVEEGVYVERALEYVRRIGPVLGLHDDSTSEFEADPDIQETTAGAVAVHLQQVYKGIPVFEAAQTVRFAPDGALEDSAGSSITIDQDIEIILGLSAVDAVLAAARHVASPHEDEREVTDQFGEPLPFPTVDLTGFEPEVVTTNQNDPRRETVLAPGPFGEAISATLTWFPLEDLRLAWETVLTMPDRQGQYLTVVDANSGEILYCRQLLNLVAARGSVYLVDGSSVRSTVAFPRRLTDYRLPLPPGMRATFPEDWVETTETLGNCTSSRQGADGGRVRGTNRDGTIVFAPTDATGPDQQVLNTFYYSCFMHSFFYLLGFREMNGNFQQDNFGLGGVGNDRVDARAHPGAVWGTANMLTPADGSSPVMNMGLVTGTGRHTALDSSVVFHEFTHGVTNRLVGGPGNANALNSPQSGGMGEGWSDFIPCVINDATLVGAWVTNRPGGIRGFPYDSDYPDHFGHLGSGRYTGPHAIGEIWCATLMEMSRCIGKTISTRLVVDALKLAPANPSFLNMRNAILNALGHMRIGGNIPPSRHAAALRGAWLTFAKFGMGRQAQSNGAQLSGIVADFATPALSEPQPEVLGRNVALVRGNAAGTSGLDIRINLFARGTDGKLWERYWGGSSWTWVDTGKAVLESPVVIARRGLGGADPADLRINLFVRGADGNLWERYWGGSSWRWVDTEKAISGQPVPLVRGDVDNADARGLRINLFVRGADGKLWERYWSGSSWSWVDTGKLVDGAPIALVRGNTASTSGGDVRINLFVRGADGKLWERYWSGSSWSWVDTGKSATV